jgi:hypothetical protein
MRSDPVLSGRGPCGPKGKAWLSKQVLPEDEGLAVERHLREFDRPGEDLGLAVIERRLARSALADDGGRDCHGHLNFRANPRRTCA